MSLFRSEDTKLIELIITMLSISSLRGVLYSVARGTFWLFINNQLYLGKPNIQP